MKEIRKPLLEGTTDLPLRLWSGAHFGGQRRPAADGRQTAADGRQSTQGNVTTVIAPREAAGDYCRSPS